MMSRLGKAFEGARFQFRWMISERIEIVGGKEVREGLKHC